MEEQLTQEEVDLLAQSGLGYPQQEDKNNIFTFFKKVLSMDDTSRTANLTETELGGVRIPVRTLEMLSLYCCQMGLTGLGEHFMKEAQVITNTSLSREGFLDKLVVTSKKEMETSTRMPPTASQKRRWFKKKNPAAP